MSEQSTQEKFTEDLSYVLRDLQQMLEGKNRKYGDSALNPQQIFSSSSAIELINIRIDDKLSRIKNSQNDDTEDAELDLMGYLLLKRIAMMRLNDLFLGKSK